MKYQIWIIAIVTAAKRNNAPNTSFPPILAAFIFFSRRSATISNKLLSSSSLSPISSDNSFFSTCFSPAKSSSTDMFSALLNAASTLTSGNPCPVSHFDTALFVTPNFSASSFCVIFNSFLLCAMNLPVLFSILRLPFCLLFPSK